MTQPLTTPFFVFICLRDYCKRQLRESFDEDGEDDNWSVVTKEKALAIIKENGWVVDENGYTYCCLEHLQQQEFESEESVRRMRYRITELLGERTPKGLRFGA